MLDVAPFAHKHDKIPLSDKYRELALFHISEKLLDYGIYDSLEPCVFWFEGYELPVIWRGERKVDGKHLDVLVPGSHLNEDDKKLYERWKSETDFSFLHDQTTLYQDAYIGAVAIVPDTYTRSDEMYWNESLLISKNSSLNPEELYCFLFVPYKKFNFNMGFEEKRSDNTRIYISTTYPDEIELRKKISKMYEIFSLEKLVVESIDIVLNLKTPLTKIQINTANPLSIVSINYNDIIKFLHGYIWTILNKEEYDNILSDFSDSNLKHWRDDERGINYFTTAEGNKRIIIKNNVNFGILIIDFVGDTTILGDMLD